MYEQLLKAIGNLGTPRILVVGDFMLDVYLYGDVARISPEAPVPVLKVTETESRCGGAASVAADLAALGAKPVCIGVVGQDAEGRTLVEKLTGLGADIAGLTETTDRPTITKQRLIGLAQHRHRQQLLRIDREVGEPLGPEVGERILRHYEDCLRQADAVCLQDYNKGVLAASLCRQMIRLARDLGKKVLVDPMLSTDYSKYRGATLITPNRVEASTAVGFEIKTPADAGKAAERLREDLELAATIVTLDKEGAYLAADGISELVPVRPRSVYDVTGAGDVVLATLAVALATDGDYRTAAHLANIAGGIEVEKFGVATVSISEMEREIVRLYGVRNTKLRALESLLEEIEWRHSRGQTIVFTNGCFDVLHRGHIEYLAFCRTQGDVVIVGLNSDSSVRAVKGPNRPINNQHDRAAVLSGLESVDYVTIFEEPSVLSLVQQLRPDILVKGGDYGHEGVVGWEFVESYGGKVVVAPLVKDRSTTGTIERIQALQVEGK
ncbi:MAG: D-glycero-beta-D-manno-heptose 1-phosphate adenylyltransferase [Sedimentisphaerales bacterium]|nr:D-glycero-beta-D-manno-heptose 1-phosphate adenylyltransferase [Sedimentisphaerales bacterium]